MDLQMSGKNEFLEKYDPSIAMLLVPAPPKPSVSI